MAMSPPHFTRLGTGTVRGQTVAKFQGLGSCDYFLEDNFEIYIIITRCHIQFTRESACVCVRLFSAVDRCVFVFCVI